MAGFEPNRQFRKDECEMMKKKSGYTASAVISIICWLAFVWMRTFTYMTNYDQRTGFFSFLAAAIFMMIAALFCWSLLKPEENSTFASLFFDDEEDYFEECDIQNDNRWSILHKSMLLLSIVAFLFLLAFALEMWTDITVFTDDIYINIGVISINKKYMFDPILFIIFPLWTQTIFRGIREEEYSLKSVLEGSIQLMLFSLLSYLLFMKLPNVWLVELAAIESIIVINGIRKYVWKHYSGKAGNVIVMTGIYELFWCSLLAIFYQSGQTFSQYTYGNGWDEYQEKVRQLVKGAAAFGSSSDLASNRVVQEFLTNKNNYFFSGLYYGGWVAAVIIVVLLVIFLLATHRLLGIHAKFNRNFLVYKAAWLSLAAKIVFGIPYSLGLLPLPFSLPFAGKVGFYMDTIGLGLLIWSAIEAELIDMSFYKVRKAADVFENIEIEVGEQELEDDCALWDVVAVHSGDKSLLCYAESDEEHNAMVLQPVEGSDNWVMIVEKNAQTDRWYDIEDGSIKDEVFDKYVKNNRPDCMEVIE